jgi:glycosyltransferase involved in cell wall biosynthesis
MSYKVSIIVPCYNQAHWLPEAVASVQAQTFTNWECIMVNDGSTDHTDAVATRIAASDNRFRYLYQENKGLGGARNTGIRHTDSPFILPLDADDKIAPDYLENAMLAFAAPDAPQLVYGKAEYFDGASGPWPLPEYRFGLLFTQNPIYCSAFYRRADWERVGGYSEDLRPGLEDWDFWLKMLEPDSRVQCLPATCFYYRRTPGSMINKLTADPKAYDAFWEKMMARHLGKWRVWSRYHLGFILEDHTNLRSEIKQMQAGRISKLCYKLARMAAGL